MPITNLNELIAPGEIDPAMASDGEVSAAIAAHLAATDPHLQYATQARGDARYFKGRTQQHTFNPPPIPAGQYWDVFVPFVGAVFGNFCVATPVSLNLVQSGMWGFQCQGIIASNDNVGIYLINRYPETIDMGTVTISILVLFS